MPDENEWCPCGHKCTDQDAIQCRLIYSKLFLSNAKRLLEFFLLKCKLDPSGKRRLEVHIETVKELIGFLEIVHDVAEKDLEAYQKYLLVSTLGYHLFHPDAIGKIGRTSLQISAAAISVFKMYTEYITPEEDFMLYGGEISEKFCGLFCQYRTFERTYSEMVDLVEEINKNFEEISRKERLFVSFLKVETLV